MTAQRGTRGARIEINFRRKLGTYARHAGQRKLRQRTVAIGHQSQELVGLAARAGADVGPGSRAAAGRGLAGGGRTRDGPVLDGRARASAELRWCRRRLLDGGCDAATRRGRALLDDPAAEASERGCRGARQAKGPTEPSAEAGQAGTPAAAQRPTTALSPAT